MIKNEGDIHLVSLSGGKDSTAMLLMMIDKGIHIDDIVFIDTGKEFDEIYQHLDILEKRIGRKITRLIPENTFEYYMFDYVKTKGKNKGEKGYGFPRFNVRWCTANLKLQTMRHYKREKYPRNNVIEYIGIAKDEEYRIKEYNPNKIYPLIQWDITEKDALEYCLNAGYDFNGIYNYFSRVSCWCCPFKSVEDYRTIYKYFPDKWAILKEWNSKSINNIRKDYSIDELEKRFIYEETKGLGKNKYYTNKHKGDK